MTTYFELKDPDGDWSPKIKLNTAYSPFIEFMDDCENQWAVYEHKTSTNLLEFYSMFLHFPVCISCPPNKHPSQLLEKLIPSRVEAKPDIVTLEAEGGPTPDANEPTQREQSIDALSESQSMGSNELSESSCDNSFSDISSVRDNMSDGSF